MAGLTTFISHKAERQKEIIQKLLTGMGKAVLIVERQAKEDCPVDTGRLRSSIASKVETAGEDITGIIGTNVDYASHVEYGTSKRPATPFLFPAVEKQKSSIAEALKDA